MRKILHSFIFVMSLFIFIFTLASCDNSPSDSGTKVNSMTVPAQTENIINTSENNNSQVDDVTQTQEEITYYTITFKNDNGEVLSSNSYKKGTTPAFDGTPTKASTAEYTYVFDGWDKEIEAANADTIYTAKFKATKNKYAITWKNYNGKVLKTDNVEYGITPKYDGDTPTKASSGDYVYKFDGWDKEIEVVTCATTYTAKFKKVKNPELYSTIIFDSNGGSDVETQEILKGEKVTKPANPKREGYTFVDWYYNDVKWNFTDNTVTEDITLIAKWEINTYYLDLDEDIYSAGDISWNYGYYEYNESITITATTNEGYTFEGWYDEDDNFITKDAVYTFNMPAKDIEYIAKWSVNKYAITLDNQSTVLITGITSGSEYEFKTEITLAAENNSKSFIVWSVDGNIEKVGNVYSFEVPAKNITITITIRNNAYVRSENKIYFGTYPQTEVYATEDNGLSSIVFDSTTWESYGYLYKGSPYAYYKDVDIDNNGTLDYRGVYYSQNKPDNIGGNPKYNSSLQINGYRTNEIYWFRYEIIEWNILEENDGKALIISNLILDSKEFSPYSSVTTITNNGKKVYANNYELSSIRKWLNDYFYINIFDDLQKELIELTIVDNSAESTGVSSNRYACDNTNDKMFLLSYSEATSYYSTDFERKVKGTDYAESQGLLKNSWRLRSPSYSDATAYFVFSDGSFSNGSEPDETCRGIRPACWIKL